MFGLLWKLHMDLNFFSTGIILLEIWSRSGGGGGSSRLVEISNNISWVCRWGGGV